MECTKADKLILRLLTNINSRLCALEPDGFKQAFLFKMIMESLDLDEDIRPSILTAIDAPTRIPAYFVETYQILDMWEALESRLKSFTKTERKTISARIRRPLVFSGFPEDSDHLTLSRFLIRDMKWFAIFRDRSLVSTHDRLALYLAMLSIFSTLDINEDGLSLVQFIEVLNCVVPDPIKTQPAQLA